MIKNAKMIKNEGFKVQRERHTTARASLALVFSSKFSRKSSILKRGVSEFFGSGPGPLIETCERCENWRGVRKIVNFAVCRGMPTRALRARLCAPWGAPPGAARFFLFSPFDYRSRLHPGRFAPGDHGTGGRRAAEPVPGSQFAKVAVRESRNSLKSQFPKVAIL